MGLYQETLYLKGDKNVRVKKGTVTLGDILAMECADKGILSQLKPLQIMKMAKKDGERHVISILEIIGAIHERFPFLAVQNLGEKDIIVTYEGVKSKNKLFKAAKTVFVALITFFGAAFSIMAFHSDVSVSKLFGQIYYWLTGLPSDGFTALEITYSIGLSAGILVFFNHSGKKKNTADPTPMEVQMRLYENDIQTTVIENAAREGRKTGACGKDNGGSDRI